MPGSHTWPAAQRVAVGELRSFAVTHSNYPRVESDGQQKTAHGLSLARRLSRKTISCSKPVFIGEWETRCLKTNLIGLGWALWRIGLALKETFTYSPRTSGLDVLGNRYQRIPESYVLTMLRSYPLTQYLASQGLLN